MDRRFTSTDYTVLGYLLRYRSLAVGSWLEDIAQGLHLGNQAVLESLEKLIQLGIVEQRITGDPWRDESCTPDVASPYAASRPSYRLVNSWRGTS